ncbi:MFS transporter [Glacieibacterium sp.]|uniref:MFS transporter n=1 Tax=Glacieibacterium sp. TaxID=2860237 RepID=UPI003B00DE31
MTSATTPETATIEASGVDPAGRDAILQLPLPRRISIFALLLCAEFLYGWAWNTVDVLRPFLRQSLSLSLIEVGSAYSAQGAGALVGAIIAAQLADCFDRRKVLAGLVMGYGLVLLAGVAVANYPELLAQRFVLGLFMGGSFPVGVSIYVNLFHASVRGRLAGTLNVAFSSSIISLGIALGFVGGQDWRLLFWLGGIPAILISLAIYILVPPFPSGGGERTRLPIRELFAPAVRTQTLLLATMTGLNFFGYQAFSGWLTTYLTGPRGLTAGVAGELVAWQFTGNIIGGFVWGWAADRFGRRFNALGFFIASAAIVLYLEVPTDLPVLRAVGFLYGATLCCSVVWGPWLAELYPPHLRATASSIFQWGRVISFFAPLITAGIATSFGLTAAMLAGAASFSLAGVIWLFQRETLQRTPATAVTA